MASDDPEFEDKAADIIGLYLKPPMHAAVFCVDEKSAIQALDRLDPVLPLSPGRAERHGFEYYRHGTLSLYGALNTQTGEVLAKTSARHTSAEFVDFLAQIVASQPPGREIHVVADNLSAHKTKRVFEFLEANPAVRIHYTPTYSSWLNQVEIWFFKIQRDVISRGIFSSVKDLARKLMRLVFCRKPGRRCHLSHASTREPWRILRRPRSFSSKRSAEKGPVRVPTSVEQGVFARLEKDGQDVHFAATSVS
jgi:transposase